MIKIKKAVVKKQKVSSSQLLAKKIAKIASDHKAIDIEVLELSALTSFTDYFVICSGSSDRQVQAIAGAIHDGLKKAGRVPISEEGVKTGHWALIDYGEVVAHIFYYAEREHYQMEKLWFDAPRINFKGVNA